MEVSLPLGLGQPSALHTPINHITAVINIQSNTAQQAAPVNHHHSTNSLSFSPSSQRAHTVRFHSIGSLTNWFNPHPDPGLISNPPDEKNHVWKRALGKWEGLPSKTQPLSRPRALNGAANHLQPIKNGKTPSQYASLSRHVAGLVTELRSLNLIWNNKTSCTSHPASVKQSTGYKRW